MRLTEQIKASPLVIHVYYLLAFLAILSASRLSLSVWLQERVSGVGHWLYILLQGVRIDVASLSIIILIPCIVSVLVSNKGRFTILWTIFVRLWLSIFAFVFIFLEFATPSFINEYNIRPNRLFIEYLIYPKEVFSMLLKSNLLELLMALFISSGVAWVTWNKIGKLTLLIKPVGWKWRPLVLVLAFFILLLGGRSSFGHRPINPSMVYFSSDPLVNSLILNSTYSVGFAAKQLFSEESKRSIYGNLPEEQTISVVREIKGLNDDAYFDPSLPTLSKQVASYKGQPKNLVIILQESLGARFVGSLGGLPLTPSFDQLSSEGWFFESMLATGTRSVRGIEAVMTGFTPTSDRSVVKLDKSQKDFFSIAEVLRRNGYHTEFIYGGESHFDNMKSFFLGNGFDYITEEKDYENPNFTGSWGVSDEDLFNKADEKFTKLANLNKPFFSLVFTSTNHSPFEYPPNRIEPYDEKVNTRNNAIKYADWALGEFVKKAKKSNYWENTVFLIVSDHDARVQGAELVPPKSFHIPALIIGKDIPVKKDTRLVSQIDIPVTLLSIAGIDNQNPMLGRDLSKNNPDRIERAYMQYGQNFAFIEGDKAIILQPGKKALRYHFDKSNFKLTFDSEASQEEKEKALGVSLWGKLAYFKRYYRTDDAESSSDMENKNSAPAFR